MQSPPLPPCCARHCPCEPCSPHLQRGEFAAVTLGSWPSCQRYILVDAWAKLVSWQLRAGGSTAGDGVPASRRPFAQRRPPHPLTVSFSPCTLHRRITRINRMWMMGSRRRSCRRPSAIWPHGRTRYVRVRWLQRRSWGRGQARPPCAGQGMWWLLAPRVRPATSSVAATAVPMLLLSASAASHSLLTCLLALSRRALADSVDEKPHDCGGTAGARQLPRFHLRGRKARLLRSGRGPEDVVAQAQARRRVCRHVPGRLRGAAAPPVSSPIHRSLHCGRRRQNPPDSCCPFDWAAGHDYLTVSMQKALDPAQDWSGACVGRWLGGWRCQTSDAHVLAAG